MEDNNLLKRSGNGKKSMEILYLDNFVVQVQA